MGKTIADVPEIRFPEDISMTGEYPARMARAAAELGPILRVALEGRNNLIFMVGPDANRFVLHTHRDHFSHEQGWTPILGDWFGHGLLNMDPPEHTRHRRLMNPAFTSAFLAVYLPTMARVVARRTRDWAARGEVDLYDEAREIAFDVAASALAGLDVGPEVDRMRELFYGLLHGFDSERESWEAFFARQEQMNHELNAIILPRIRDRRRSASQPRDVVSMIVAARDENGQPLTDEQILAHVKILLVAGHETTTTLAAWTLYLLAERTEDRQRVLTELNVVGGPVDGPLSLEHLRSLKYLDSFMKEVGRLYAPVIQVPRGVLREFEFDGYAIPAGVQVRLAIAAGHRLPTVFPNPERFEPARFEPPREEDRLQPYSLVTFGGGPRVCIGMSFAQLEVKSLVAHVLRHLELTPVKSRPPFHAGYWTAIAPNGVVVRAELTR